jgi:hypothetical protein
MLCDRGSLTYYAVSVKYYLEDVRDGGSTQGDDMTRKAREKTWGRSVNRALAGRG